MKGIKTSENSYLKCQYVLQNSLHVSSIYNIIITGNSHFWVKHMVSYTRTGAPAPDSFSLLGQRQVHVPWFQHDHQDRQSTDEHVLPSEGQQAGSIQSRACRLSLDFHNKHHLSGRYSRGTSGNSIPCVHSTEVYFTPNKQSTPEKSFPTWWGYLPVSLA